MLAIELYRNYLYNSVQCAGAKERGRKLLFEHNKISEILDGLDNLFYMDKSILDKKDSSIYTYIKREILSSALHGEKESALYNSKFFLQGILNEIDSMKRNLIA